MVHAATCLGILFETPNPHIHGKNLLTPLFLMGCFPVDFQEVKLGARLRGGTATQRSKIRVLSKVLGRVLGKRSQKGSEKGGLLWVLQ